jgi:hypothetical protein
MVRFIGQWPMPAVSLELPVPTDPATVAANASGLLTPQQQAQLLAALDAGRRQGAARVIQAAIVALFLGSFVACAALSGISQLSIISALVRDIAQRGIPDLSDLPILLFVTPALFFVLFGWVLLYGMVIEPLRTGALRRRIRREVEAGRVAQAEGEVRARRGGYVARAGGRTLRSPIGARAVFLAPGTYSFYFLPSTGVLVSAEPRQGLSTIGTPGILGAPGMPSAALVATLGRALRFSEDDLALNRQGRLSERQRRRIVRSMAVWTVIVLALCLVVPPILIVAVRMWQVGCVIAIILLLAGGILLLLRISARDLRSGMVLAVRGPVQRMMVSDGEGGRTYHYTVAGLRFMVSRAAYDALIPNLPYAVYYLPRGRALLSMEPLAAAPQVAPTS